MKTKTYNVYSFDELSDKAKEAAINKWIEANYYACGFPFLEDHLNDILAHLLSEAKIEGDAKIYYSLSYSQGDGAMFEGNFNWNGFTVTVKQSGHYYHYNSKSIEFEKECSDDDEQTFNEVYVGICKELENAGYSYIEDILSSENITSEIQEAGKCWFTESGKLDEIEP